jgi:F-box and WD-40 domain protein CDC4
MARYVTNDHGVVTTLCMSDKYIIVGLDNASIRVFDEDGKFQMTLAGHETGVWAMVIVGEDQLVSGGCDRDMRLWNLTTGYPIDCILELIWQKMRSGFTRTYVHRPLHSISRL